MPRPIRQRLSNFLPDAYRIALQRRLNISASIRLGIVGGASWLGGVIAAAALQAGVIHARDLAARAGCATRRTPLRPTRSKPSSAIAATAANE